MVVRSKSESALNSAARRRQAGAIGFGGLFLLAILGCGIYAGFKFLPPTVANFEFNNDVQQEARLALYNGDSDDAIRSKLLNQAQSLGIPIVADQIAIARPSGDVSIAAQYQITVAIPGRVVTLNFRDGDKEIPITDEP